MKMATPNCAILVYLLFVKQHKVWKKKKILKETVTQAQTNSSFSDTNSSNSSLSLKGYSTQTGSTTYFGTLEYTPPEFF